MKHILKWLFKSKICCVMLILLEHNEKIEKIWEGKINNPKNNGKRKRKIPTFEQDDNWFVPGDLFQDNLADVDGH